MKNLVIVESPNKCSTIEKYLDKNFKVLSCIGHFRDLFKGNNKEFKYGFDPKNLEIKWVIKKDKKVKKAIEDLQKNITLASHVYIATDPDREGEAIAWHLKEYFNIKENKYNRITFNAIRKENIEQALAQPGKINYNLFNAYLARRLLDRVIGWDLSSFIQQKLNLKKYIDTTGRVQSVALWFIAKREEEIKNFIPQSFSVIEALVVVNKLKHKVIFPSNNIEKNFLSRQKAKNLVAKIPQKVKVSKIKKENKKSKAIFPLKTSTLYREAYKNFGYSPKKTLALAQKLFQKGYISYHRTDSLRIEKSFQQEIGKHVKKTLGNNYYIAYQNTKKQDSQDAHEAIIALDLGLTPLKFASKNKDLSLQKVYQLIYNHTICCMVKAPVYESITLTLQAGDIDFKLLGQKVVFDGYLKVMGSSGLEIDFSQVQINDLLPISDITIKDKQTKPPSRYNPSSLIKELEDKRVGRPSTFSMMVETVINDDKNYSYIEDKKIFATKKGLEVSQILANNFSKIISPTYTKKLEDKLDLISKNEIKFKKWFLSFKTKFSETIKLAYKNVKQKPYQLTGTKCPNCQSELVYKESKKYDKYIVCLEKNCGYYKVEWKKHSTNCSNCKIPFLVKKNNKGVEFLACSNYPSCKKTARIDGFIPTLTNEVCPQKDCNGFLMNQKNKKTGELFKSCQNWFKHRKARFRKK